MAKANASAQRSQQNASTFGNIMGAVGSIGSFGAAGVFDPNKTFMVRLLNLLHPWEESHVLGEQVSRLADQRLCSNSLRH